MALVACASPTIELMPSFPVGTQRVYTLTIEATTDIDVPGAVTTERTSLEARSTLEVIGEAAEGARVSLTIEPLRSVRNGIEQQLTVQRVELIVRPDGSVASVVSIDGLPAGLDDGVDDLAPMLGLALPDGTSRLGHRWRRDLADGEQTGRIAAVRTVRGFDAAIVQVGSTRTLRRQTAVDERTLALIGTEFSSSTIAFAIADGFPVQMSTTSEGRFAIEGDRPGSGAVMIRSHTELTLESAGARAG